MNGEAKGWERTELNGGKRRPDAFTEQWLGAAGKLIAGMRNRIGKRLAMAIVRTRLTQ